MKFRMRRRGIRFCIRTVDQKALVRFRNRERLSEVGKTMLAMPNSSDRFTVSVVYGR